MVAAGRKAVQLATAGALAACGALAQIPSTQTSSTAQNGATVSLPIGSSCWMIQDVGVEAGNPLSAEQVSEYVSHPEGKNEVTSERVELVARDSSGRIRFKRTWRARTPNNAEEVTLNTRDGGTFTVSKKEYATLIQIFDTPHEKFLSVQPGMRIARIHPASFQVNPKLPCHPYSFFITSRLFEENKPDFLVEDPVEDLGVKEIEGFPVRGMRTTRLGKEADGKWSGKPVEIHEVWASDELAATVLEIRSDLKNRSEGKSRLIKIKREEPEASLFEIPAGYKINPTKEEMPFIKSQPKVTAPQK